LLIVCDFHAVRLRVWVEGIQQRGDGKLGVTFGTNSRAPEVIPPYVEGDAACPRGQRRRATVARKTTKQVDKGFLREVVRQRGVTRAPR
jgi:hypothetical protein